jgi:proteasome accessory factor B
MFKETPISAKMPRMSRCEQVIRHLIILTTLGNGTGATLHELSQILGVTVRTVQRDLEALQAVPFPIVDETGEDRKKRWKTIGNFHQHIEVPFTLSELISLYLALNTLEGYRESSFYKDILELCRKIQCKLNGDSLKYFEEIRDLFHTQQPKVKIPKTVSDFLSFLAMSILRHQRLILHYYSTRDQRIKKYTVDPYLIIPRVGRFYLHAYVHEYKETRTFAIDDRMRGIENTGGTFIPPNSNELKHRIENSFGILNEKPLNVKIKFRPQVERLLKTTSVHPTQRIKKDNDGNIIFTMKAGGRDEIMWWVLSFGTLAEVLEPPELREQVIKTLEESLKQYQG